MKIAGYVLIVLFFCTSLRMVYSLHLLNEAEAFIRNIASEEDITTLNQCSVISRHYDQLQEYLSFSIRPGFQHLAMSQLLLKTKRCQDTNNYSFDPLIFYHLSKSISFNPYWAETWAIFTKVDFEKFNNSERLNYYILHSLKLGKFENEVQMLLYPLILENWEELNELSRQIAILMIKHMLTYRGAQKAVETAKQKCKLKLIKPYASNSKQQQNITNLIHRFPC